MQLKRIRKRRNLGTYPTEGNRFSSHEGELVAWWPGGLLPGPNTPGIPMAEMVFRKLSNGNQLGAFFIFQIELSLIGVFRRGTIWSKGRCVGEIRISEDYIGRVDFNNARLVHASTITKSQPNPNHLSLPPTYQKSWIIEIPSSANSEVTVLIPCTELFIRCYGSSKLLLTTIIESYKPDLSLSQFVKKIACDEMYWEIKVSKNTNIGDHQFLAHLLYDDYAFSACKRVNAEAITARAKRELYRLKVTPWFKGKLHVGGKGIWIEPEKKFLLLDINKFEMPPHPPLTVVRTYLDHVGEDAKLQLPKASSACGTDIPPEKGEFQNEPPITSKEQPNNTRKPRGKADGTLRLIGLKRNVVYVKDSQPHGGIVPAPPRGPADKMSTGHTKNSQGTIDKVHIHTDLSEKESGYLWAIWTALHKLKDCNPCIESIESYVIPNQTDKTHPKIMNFPVGIVRPLSSTGRWIAKSNSLRKSRGVMVVRLNANNRQFYIIEIEKIGGNNDTESKSEHLSGLIFELDDPGTIDKAIGKALTGLAKNYGRYDKEYLPSTYALYAHSRYPGNPIGKSARQTFELMGLLNPTI
ncbi:MULTISPECIES: hypothetical protein [Pseudomonadaceae]|uniref:hypothetical protein n=1 Tax=Pseudomonas solani TaxID=2731552 RepID=UPI00041586F7